MFSSISRAAALLGAQHAGEVAEVVDRQRQVGGQRLADRLAVVPGLGDGEHLEVLLDPVGDLVAGCCERSAGEVLPHAGAAACAASRAASMSSAVPRATSVNGLPLTGEMFSKYSPLIGLDPLAADEVAVAALDRDQRVRRPGGCVDGHVCLPTSLVVSPGGDGGDVRKRNVATTLHRAQVGWSGPGMPCSSWAWWFTDVMGSVNHHVRRRAVGCGGSGAGAVLAVEPGDLPARPAGAAARRRPSAPSWAIHIS